MSMNLPWKLPQREFHKAATSGVAAYYMYLMVAKEKFNSYIISSDVAQLTQQFESRKVYSKRE